MPGEIYPLDVLERPSQVLGRWVTERFKTGNEAPNEFGYFRFNDSAVRTAVTAANPMLGYFVGAYFEVRHIAVCAALWEMIPDLVQSIAAHEAVASSRLDELTDHLEQMVAEELAAYPALPDLTAAFSQLAETLGQAGALSDAALFAAFRGEQKTRPQGGALTASGRAATKTENLTSLQVSTPQHIYEETFPPGPDGLYYMRWSSVEWPPLINDPYMLYCVEKSVLGDNPNLLEIPGERQESYPQKSPPGGVFGHSVTGNGVYVSKVWEADRFPMPGGANTKMPRYLVDEDLLTVIPAGESTVLYSAVLLDTGDPTKLIKWKDLGDKLKKVIAEKVEELANRVTEALKGVSLGGIPLGPLGAGAQMASQALTAILQAIIDWLVDNLSITKFSPLVIAHRTIYNSYLVGLRRTTDPPRSYVTYSRRDPDTGNVISQPLAWYKSSGFPPDDDRARTVQWDGESLIPNQKPRGTSGPLINRVKPNQNLIALTVPVFYWPDSQDYGGHVLAMLRRSGGQYNVACRTEVRLRTIEFPG